MAKFKFQLLQGRHALAVPRLDEHGRPVPKLDLHGNPVKGRRGEVLHELDTRTYRAGDVIETDEDLEAQFNSYQYAQVRDPRSGQVTGYDKRTDNGKAQKFRRVHDGEVVGGRVVTDLNQLDDGELDAKIAELTGIAEGRKALKLPPPPAVVIPPQPAVPGQRQPVAAGAGKR